MTLEQDFRRLDTVNIPARRAAYSDRTAWLMAILAELAYQPFDLENKAKITTLARELAALTEPNLIEGKLTAFREVLISPDETGDQKLKAALKAGSFTLTKNGILFDPATDTQGFVAVRRRKGELGMAVLCFRGTEKVEDWKTNLLATPCNIENPDPGQVGVVGKMHKGFHSRYKTVEEQIKQALEGSEDLPLYITGHSLGGALAVVATWYQSSRRLAACYTFGAPRVCDHDLMGRFKTPIYRIVNGPDPVPFVPPSGMAIDAAKAVLRMAGAVITPLNLVADWLVRIQGYRHIGYMRYLSATPEGPDGTYPKLTVEYSLSSMNRLSRFLMMRLSAKADRIDKYHAMERYRAKLRAQALRVNGA